MSVAIAIAAARPETRANTCTAKIPSWMKGGFNRVLGGTDAPGPVPWLVSIRSIGFDPTKPWDGPHFCGGTILNPTTILTAAHCFPDKESDYNAEFASEFGNWVYVWAGAHKLNEGKAKSQAIKVKKLIKYSKFNSATNVGDVAILKLSQALTYNDNVQAACLPDASFAPDAAKKKAVLTGWGSSVPQWTTEAQKTTNTLQWLPLPLMTNAECNKNSHWDDITDLKLCAGYLTNKAPEKSSCQGDSGGPLVVANGDSAVVYGIVSYGPGTCGEAGFTSVFCRVSKVLDFIKANM